MKDNFDLKKFLKESKAIENLNPSLKTINEKEDKSLKENSLKSKIREMIIDELSEDNVSVGGDVRGTINPGGEVVGKENPYNPTYESKSEELHETDEEEKRKESIKKLAAKEKVQIEKDARKSRGDIKEEEEDEGGEEKETESREEMEDESHEERADVDKYEFEKGKEDGEKEGGIEAIAADLDGTESDLMGNLMNALKIAKGMDNEKLEVQIGNTLKFFVSTFIDKEENER